MKVDVVRSGLRNAAMRFVTKPSAVPGAFTSPGFVGVPVTAVKTTLVPLTMTVTVWPLVGVVPSASEPSC